MRQRSLALTLICLLALFSAPALFADDTEAEVGSVEVQGSELWRSETYKGQSDSLEEGTYTTYASAPTRDASCSATCETTISIGPGSIGVSQTCEFSGSGDTLGEALFACSVACDLACPEVTIVM